MKKVLSVLTAFALMLLSYPAFAESIDSSTQGIVGSDAHALLDAIQTFGIETPNPQTGEGKVLWTVRSADINGVNCEYSILANEAGEIISASFTMRGSDNGLFAVAAAMSYDTANPDVAASFIKSGLNKETAITIGDAHFSLRTGTMTSTSSISINGRTSSSTTKTTTYNLRIEYTSEASGEILLVKLNHEAKLREADNGNSKYHGTAKKGEELMVITPFYSEQWHQIIYNGEIYFVYADYCEFISE